MCRGNIFEATVTVPNNKTAQPPAVYTLPQKICYSFFLSSLHKRLFFSISASRVSSVSLFTPIRLFSHLNTAIWNYKKVKNCGITILFTLQHCSFRHIPVVGFEILSAVFRNVDSFLLIYTASYPIKVK